MKYQLTLKGAIGGFVRGVGVCGSVWLSKKSCDVYMMVQMAVLLGCLSLAWSLETQRFTISCNFLCYCVSLSSEICE